MSDLITATRKATATHSLGGSSAVTYNLILRIRLKCSLKTYTGGSNVQKYVISGAPTPAVDNYETVKLTVSNPSTTYYLNAGVSGSPDGAVFLDYRLPVTVKGDAVLTVEIDTIDTVVPADLVIGEDTIVSPEDDVLDKFSGVFCQIDHEAEYISATVVETTGGGVRGFRFGGYSEQVYLSGAEQ